MGLVINNYSSSSNIYQLSLNFLLIGDLISFDPVVDGIWVDKSWRFYSFLFLFDFIVVHRSLMNVWWIFNEILIEWGNSCQLKPFHYSIKTKWDSVNQEADNICSLFSCAFKFGSYVKLLPKKCLYAGLTDRFIGWRMWEAWEGRNKIEIP